MGKRKRKPKARGYVRPSRARPRSGWTIRQLAELTGVPGRTIRSYLTARVLPRSPFKGPETRYQRPQLLALLAIRRLRETQELSLAAIRKRLQAVSVKELEAMAIAGLESGRLADALGIKPRVVAARAPGGDVRGNGSWVRMELALGLELHVRDDASPEVQALASHLRELSSAGAG